MLRAGAPLERYGDRVKAKATPNGTRLLELDSSHLTTRRAVPKQLSVRYGKAPFMVDHRARVLAIDAKRENVKVLALERGVNGITRTARWIPWVTLAPAAAERQPWPDGVRVFPGVGADITNAAVVVIDRSRDPMLRGFLAREVAPLRTLHATDVKALVDSVARLVRSKLTYSKDVDAKLRGDEVLLGDFLRSKGGVCRHYAALTKVALDSLEVPGLMVRYTTGRAYDPFGFPSENHAWIEVTMPDGATWAVDPTWVGLEPSPQGRGTLAPTHVFYARHGHQPSYENKRAIWVPADAAIAPSGGTPIAAPILGAPIAKAATPLAARPAPSTSFGPGQRIAWRFFAETIAVDPAATILEVGPERSLLRTVERRMEDGRMWTRPVTVWVPTRQLEQAVSGHDPRDGLLVRTDTPRKDRQMHWVRVHPRRDLALRAFLDAEIRPLIPSTAPTRDKISRAIGRVRQRLAASDGQGPWLGQFLGLASLRPSKGSRAAHVGQLEAPYAAAALAAIDALEVPGLVVRVISGQVVDPDGATRGTDNWLEVEYTEHEKPVRLIVEPRSGRVSDPVSFYRGGRRVPAPLPPVKALPRVDQVQHTGSAAWARTKLDRLVKTFLVGHTQDAGSP